MRQRWEYTNHKIQEEWRREGEDWSRVDWTTQEEANKRYPDWNQGMTIAGMVPMGAKERMQHPGHKATKLINKTVNTILKTAQKVWEERNQAVQDWIDSKPELKERKAQADKTGWKAMPRERQKRKRDKKDGGEGKGERYDRIKEEATEKIEEIRENKRIKAEGEMENIISYCEKHSIVPAHPAARERWTQNRIKEMCKEAEREKRQRILRAEMAVGTRDLKETEMGSGRMQDTMPTMATGKRKFHWTPKIGLKVWAFWTGEGDKREGNLEGKWWHGKVISLEWPEDKGIPGANIKYTDGHIEWHGINTFGITIKPVIKPKDKRGVSHEATLPKQALEWLGIGSRMKVRWTGPGYMDGEVIGRETKGIMVKYNDGSVVAHTDLEWRGCKVTEYRRPRDQDKYYQERPWLGCPYEGEEEDCECWPCREDEKWRGIVSKINREDAEHIMALPLAQREEALNKIPEINQHTSEGHFDAENEQGERRPSDRAGNAKGNAHGEGTHEDSEMARQQGNQIQRGEDTHRIAKSGQNMGMDSRSNRQERTRAQRQGSVEAGVAGGRRTGSAGGAGGKRVARKRRGESERTQTGGHGNGDDLDQGKRRRGEGRHTQTETPETHADDDGEEEDGKEPRRDQCDLCGPGNTVSTGQSQCNRGAEQTKQQRQVGHVDRRCRGVDAGRGVDTGRGGQGDTEQSSGNERATTEGGGTHCSGHRGGLGEREESPTGSPRGNSGRGRQEGTHKHRSEARGDNCSCKPRPSEQGEGGYTYDAGEEGRRQTPPMDARVDVPGMLINVNSKRDKSGNRVSTWKVGEHGAEQKEHHRGEDTTRGGVPEGDERSPGEHNGGTATTPRTEIRTGEPSNLADVEGGTTGRGDQTEPTLENGPGRPVRLRKKVSEAHAHPHESERLGTSGQDGEREVQDRRVRRNGREQEREQSPQRADSAELQREEAEPGAAQRRQMGLRQGGDHERGGRRTDNGDNESSNKGDRGREKKRKPDGRQAEGPPCGAEGRGRRQPPMKKQKTGESQPEKNTQKRKKEEKTEKSKRQKTGQQSKVYDSQD